MRINVDQHVAVGDLEYAIKGRIRVEPLPVGEQAGSPLEGGLALHVQGRFFRRASHRLRDSLSRVPGQRCEGAPVVAVLDLAAVKVVPLALTVGPLLASLGQLLERLAAVAGRLGAGLAFHDASDDPSGVLGGVVTYTAGHSDRPPINSPPWMRPAPGPTDGAARVARAGKLVFLSQAGGTLPGESV
jgi:hypothetical protein